MTPKMIALVLLAAITLPSHAAETDARFFEIKNDDNTVAFDMSTLQMIVPGKFSIEMTTIDNPDVMKLELKVADVLHNFCNRPDGQHAAPPDMLTLGTPELPVKEIQVKNQTGGSIVIWSYPYARFASFKESKGIEQRTEFLFCNDYLGKRQSIMNGKPDKRMYDCKRGLIGFFITNVNHNEPLPMVVKKGTRGDDEYRAVCYRALHEMPFEPQ